MFKKIFIFLLIALSIYANKPLTPNDIKQRLDKILKMHVTYKSLNSTLIERIFRNFIENLDKNKTYFLENEIEKWIYPSQEDKNKWLSQFQALDFQEFFDIYNLFLTSIERRKEIEKNTPPITQDVKIEEIKNTTWAFTKKELENRIQKIKILFIQTAEKLKDETFIKRAEKIKEKREEKIKKDKNLIYTDIMKAICKSLGPHTNYLTKTETEHFLLEVQQSFTGIGAMLQDQLNGLKIMSFVKNGPAAKSKKLKINDKIIAVNKMTIVGMDISDAVSLIRGKPGSSVILTILRKINEDELKLDVSITRDKVILEKNRIENSLLPYANGVIGYIHLHSFYDDQKTSSGKDIKKFIEDTKKNHNLKGVILDLRGNSGGLLTQSVEVTANFITKGPVVSIKNSYKEIKCLRDVKGELTYEGPLMILTDRTSASCSEIVAGTLKDYNRAIIVGDDRTFGKGSSQVFSKPFLDISKIDPKGEYKVTTAKYYTVSGKSPQIIGIKPDIEIPGIFSQSEIGEEFEKYPLENDSIAPNFDDNLSDIPDIYKTKINIFYKNNLQKVLDIYSPYIETLKKNSQKRIQKDKIYQHFLEEIKNKNYSENFEIFHSIDLQKQEAINVMKDLIFLMEKN